MDETTEKVVPNEEPPKVPESPKPLAFTIDFGEKKPIDTQRFKNLVEKYQSRHKRGQSLSKFDDPPNPVKKHPLTGNLPRKASFHSEGYFSSDEKTEKKYQMVRSTVLNTVISKADLTLPLTKPFPSRSFDLPSISSPEIELKDVSSPELDLISPISPLTISTQSTSKQALTSLKIQHSSPESEPTDAAFISALEHDFDKADTVSDAGTYTLDGDNYTEEQKARMSIDKYFNIEQVSVIKKTQEYIQSLQISTESSSNKHEIDAQPKAEITPAAQIPKSPTPEKAHNSISKKIFNKILYPSVKSHSTEDDPDQSLDQGCFTSITASGVLSKRPEKRGHVRRSSLVQSEIFVEAYTGDPNMKQPSDNIKIIQTISKTDHIQKRRSLNLDELPSKPDLPISNLPPSVGGVSGKNSPSKIPSPVHTITRPRSRNSLSSSQNLDFSDSSLETESYLKPTQNIISSLQARLSLDSDQDSDYDHHRNYAVALNNETKNLLKNKPMHVRHNSFDDRTVKISNKLEHFHNKNLQSIDQTFKPCNQYSTQNKTVHRIQNSPNNSPIRRSSSFSLKNQFDNQPKCLNKDSNVSVYNSPNFQQRNGVSRSSSTANIKPNIDPIRRSSISADQKHKYLDSESSTDEDFDKSGPKNKKDLTTTRYNRAFSLRRARLDAEPSPKCPNTPEMRRKFGSNEKPSERTVSVDRKTGKGPDIQSRYMNIGKQPKNPIPVVKAVETPKMPPKMGPKLPGSKPQVFSRTDTGRFSMRTPKPPTTAPKPMRRDPQGKKQSGPRCNSTLSSREVEFQNWKRRKSYDPMKAAAEGKRKLELARKQTHVMTQSYNEGQDCDSSPSHSSSVHRSQSFHGTAALEQLLSSEEDEDLTLSGDEGFSPPTPSPCEMSPSRPNLRQVWMERFSASSKR